LSELLGQPLHWAQGFRYAVWAEPDLEPNALRFVKCILLRGLAWKPHDKCSGVIRTDPAKPFVNSFALAELRQIKGPPGLMRRFHAEPTGFVSHKKIRNSTV
jgi:hypothetical protein